MRILLAMLMRGQRIECADFALYAYSDGSGINARLEHNALTYTEKPTLAGLTRLLAWVEAELTTSNLWLKEGAGR